MKPLTAYLMFLVLVLTGGFAGAAEGNHPNVLFIAIDDLNDWVGFLQGHPQVRTPHMDRLAKRGVVFASAQCAAPLCCPSRAALFSGQQPFRTGIYDNTQNIRQLRPDVVLLPQSFAAAGYRTVGAGKLLHHATPELFDQYFRTEQRWSPFAASKDVVYSQEDLPRKPSDPRHTVRLNDKEVTLPLNGMPSDRNPAGPAGESFDWGPFDVADEQMGDGKVANWAAERLREASDKPLLLCVGFYRPHIPLWAPRKYFELYPERTIKLPEVLASDLDDLSESGRKWAVEAVTAGAHATVVKHDEWHAAVAAYLACVSFVDDQIGKLLDALDASPHADNTVIVLFGDHGWHLGEKQHWGKWTGWERATRVPLAIVPPRQQAAKYRTGAVCTQPVGLIDLYPTLLELCGLPARDDLDGESLVKLLQDPSQSCPPEVTTFDYGNYSIRDSRWRLIHYRGGSEERYDHESDPHEWHNLAGDARHDEIRLALAKHIPSAAVPSAGGAKKAKRRDRVAK